MTLKSAFSLIAAGTILLLVTTITIFTQSMDLMEKDAKNIKDVVDRVYLAEEFENLLRKHNREAFLYLLTKKPERLVLKKESRIELNKILDGLRSNVNGQEKELLINSIVKEVDDYFSIRREIDESGMSPTDAYRTVIKSVDHISTRVDALVSLNTLEAQRLEADIVKRNKVVRASGIIFVAFSASVLLFALGSFFQFVYRPLVKIGYGLKSFGQGESRVRLKPNGLKDIKDIAAIYNTMADHLDQRKKDQLQFLTSVAHDLRNPLGSVLMSTELLISQQKGGKNAEEKQLLEIIQRQMKSLDRMVGDLLDTTRVEAGNIELKISRFEIGSLLRDAVQLHRASVTIHDIRLDLPDEDIHCECDQTRISQVVNNLISNAIRYSPRGGLIQITAAQKLDRVIISVSDQGIGVDPDEYETIFEPFRRGKATKETILGIGLGLSASRRIVRAHNGSIVVTGQPGVGSTFTVTLPQSRLKKRPDESKVYSDRNPTV
ncbi:MAG: hypothetical protein COT73_09180 [Bdellovibrio sp. CG10_big_fil_rev_8_21_14_0_10_47_8]|nr:MAG: hypothetical protein COT73_09180 [Bdellovibrio sp. CG10_big_fil_rev_8_21_14_0_10_47_8]